MRRREFVRLVGGIAAFGPLKALAQRPTPVIGYLHSGSENVWRPFIDAFGQGLHAAGYTVGQNALIEYRWAEGAIDRLPALAAELVSRNVSVIAASGGGNDAALAAKAATHSIPIVFTTGNDPVEAGLVSSLAQPAGNVTGVSILNSDTQAKRLELAQRLVPYASTIFLLGNPRNPNTEAAAAEMQRLVHAGGQDFQFVAAGTPSELDSAFERMGRVRRAAVIIAIDPLFNDQSRQIASLAAQYKMATVYYSRVFMLAGGLASYGGNTAAAYELAGEMVGQILSGAKPQDMPVRQSVKFELLLNLKSAKALGMTISPSLLALADEVIE